MICGLRINLGRGAGTLRPCQAIETWDRGEHFFENGEFVFTRDGRVNNQTIESELPAKEMTCTPFGTDVGDVNRPNTMQVLILSVG